jgi:hypothetical protein
MTSFFQAMLPDSSTSANRVADRYKVAPISIVTIHSVRKRLEHDSFCGLWHRLCSEKLPSAMKEQTKIETANLSVAALDASAVVRCDLSCAPRFRAGSTRDSRRRIPLPIGW